MKQPRSTTSLRTTNPKRDKSEDTRGRGDGTVQGERGYRQSKAGAPIFNASANKTTAGRLDLDQNNRRGVVRKGRK